MNQKGKIIVFIIYLSAFFDDTMMVYFDINFFDMIGAGIIQRRKTD